MKINALVIVSEDAIEEARNRNGDLVYSRVVGTNYEFIDIYTKESYKIRKRKRKIKSDFIAGDIVDITIKKGTIKL